MGPVRFHFLICVVVREPFFVHKNHSRSCRSVLHSASLFTMAQPPCSLGSCRVVTGTRKISPCQMNQVHTVFSCYTCSFVGGRICARYQIFARRRKCMYCILCARQRVRAWLFLACARTAPKAPVQLSFTDFAMVVPYWIPRIVTWS